MRKIFALALIAVASLTRPVFALDYLGRFSLGGGYGVGWPTDPEGFKTNNESNGDIWSGNVKIGIAHNAMLVASYSNFQIENENTHRDTILRPIILSLRYYAFRHTPINPYLTAGAGISRNTEYVNNEKERYTKFAAQGGVGVEFFITPTASIGAEGLYHHIVASSDEAALRLLSAIGTVNFYFGAPDSTVEARREADKAKLEADRAKSEQDRLRQQNETNAAAVATSQQAADEARLEAERQAAAARTAQQQLSDNERQNQELQSQIQAAQAEVEQIQGMIQRREMQPINFATGSDQLLPASRDALDKVSAVIAKYPKLKLRVEGHTDSVGNDAANLRLSQRRADAVKNSLVGKNNTPSSQVEAVGFGESKPVASNDNADGRAQNRRVEFIFVLP